MDSAKHAFLLFLHGLKDCFSGFLALKDFLCAQELHVSGRVSDRVHMRRSNHQGSVRSKLFRCAVFGLYFWISNFVFNRLFLQYFVNQLAEWTGDHLNSNGGLQIALYGLFCVGWIFPLLILSKILNFIWYQDIANVVLSEVGVQKSYNVKLSEFWADLIKSVVLQMFYCFQALFVYFLPLPVFIQDLWCLFHFSLLYSLYAFEYKWIHMGWPMHRRLLNIDRKWPYYLGFGLPLAIVTTYFTTFIASMIIFAAFFPIYVISSSVTYDSQSPVFSHPFHTFKVADFLSDKFILSIPWLKR